MGLDLQRQGSKEFHDLLSFLAFANYLREYLDPDWTEYAHAFSPLRKKKVEKDFPKLWNESEVKVAGKP